MNDVVTIENTEMQIREYNGQRVVTFKDIDRAHQRKGGTARNAFNRNKKHFVRNEDYFVCKTYEAKELYGITAPNGLTVLTESGYLMLVKPFTDDLSWSVQRQLVNTYFKAKREYELPADLTPKIPFKTSSTPVPRNPNWYQRNRRRMNRISEKLDISLSYLYHHILVRLGEEFNLDAANEIYRKELGHPPKYALDIVSYFPELGRLADEYLDMVEKL